MRILMHIKFPLEPFNASVRDGTVGKKLERILAELKHEAVYFTENHGHRGAIMVIDMNDASQIPAFAEPWFLLFNAECEFHVAMTPQDLAKAGLDKLGKKWA